MLPMKDCSVAYAHIGFYIRDNSYIIKALEMKRTETEVAKAIMIL